MLSACGVVTGVTDKNELIVSNSIMERRLTLSESVMWYGLLFDALRYGECIGRYGRSEKNLNAELAPPSEVIQSLLDDELLCVGVQSDCGEFFRRKGHWAMYYDRFLHWNAVEQSPVRDKPLSEDEDRIMGMMISENWSIAELVRNFVKGYDASMTRFDVPEERYGILSLDPDDDLVRINYERHPMVHCVTNAVLNLIRGRLLLLY